MTFQRGLLLMLFSLLPALASADTGPETGNDKTNSPYFFVKSDDDSIEAFPLKGTEVSSEIAGVIANVTVTQTYKNEGKKPIEARYVFPASTRAAVHEMKMQIGERTIEANIKERDSARTEYNQARDAGKTASLLEEQRPNVFEMNVANILPGDDVKVTLKYTELLIPTEKTYEFVYPTVVGPRYSNQPEESAPAREAWIKNPYLQEGEKSPSTFSINVKLNGGMDIESVGSPSHKVAVNYEGKTTAGISLDKVETNPGNKDFVLQYRLGGDRIHSGLLLYPGDKENFFLLMAQPPSHSKAESIVPREYVFIVDVSGSMYGFPLDVSKKLMNRLLSGLRTTDKFNILLFSGGSDLLAPESLSATKENIQKGISFIDEQHGGGGTELVPALKRALALKRSDDVSRSFVLVTDGYVSVERESFDLVRDNLGKANFFAFGIGSSVNRYLIEGLSHVGRAEPFVITKESEASEKADAFKKLIESPVLTDVMVDFQGLNVSEVEPSSIPDLFLERPVILFGKYSGSPSGTVKVSGKSAEGAFSESINVTQDTASSSNGALRYLWAREKIRTLSDYSKASGGADLKGDITKLGLTYNLLTEFTSFIAVDSEARTSGKDTVTVRQPLPLPDGVSNYALPAAPTRMNRMIASASGGLPRELMAADSEMREEGVLDKLAAKTKEALKKSDEKPGAAVESDLSRNKDIKTLQNDPSSGPAEVRVDNRVVEGVTSASRIWEAIQRYALLGMLGILAALIILRRMLKPRRA